MAIGGGMSLKVVRRHCLDCCAGERKAIIWCPCDGLHSPRCEFWKFRFGAKPATIRERYGPALVTPKMMPDATVNLDALPGGIEAAAAYLSGRLDKAAG